MYCVIDAGASDEKVVGVDAKLGVAMANSGISHMAEGFLYLRARAQLMSVLKKTASDQSYHHASMSPRVCVIQS